jgi:plasmid stabilization system protein ParE
MEALGAAEYIARNAPLNAARWYDGLETAIHSLRHLPARCAIAPESQYLGAEFRHFIYKSHRIIFRVDEIARVVRVLHIRHGARRAIGEPENFPDS